MRAATLLLAACLLVAAAAASLARAGTTAVAVPDVTFLGDSASFAIGNDPVAAGILRRGVDVRLEAAVCRRLARVSCPDGDVRPPTVLDLIARDGDRLGRTVVVAVGYNDPESEYAGEIEEVVTALEAAGVERILWVTLRAVRQPHLTMNEAIRAAAARHPRMVVVDWNELARTRPSWFAEDGIHLERDGARAMAALVRRTLGAVGAARPLPPLAIATPSLPGARVGRPYAVALAATGGEPVYRWKRLGPALPAGLRLSAAGRLGGVPTSTGRFRLTLRVTDTVGVAIDRDFSLSIAR